MAITVKTLRDAELDATIKIIYSGGSAAATTINVSDLSGAEDDGTDRVRISRILVTADEPVLVEWEATANTDAIQLTSGQLDWSIGIPNDAGAGVTGDLIITPDSVDTKFTMFLFLKKTAGFKGTALSYRKVMPPRRA
jgi:hypothetical protein